MTKKKPTADNIQQPNRVIGHRVHFEPETLEQVDALADRYDLPNPSVDAEPCSTPERETPFCFRQEWHDAATDYWLHRQWQDGESGHRGTKADQNGDLQALQKAAEDMEKVLGKLNPDREFKLQQAWGERRPYGDPDDRGWKTRMLNDAVALKWATKIARNNLPHKYPDDAWWWFLKRLVRIWEAGGKEVPNSITYKDVGADEDAEGDDQPEEPTPQEKHPQEIAQFVFECVRLAGITESEKSDGAIGKALRRLFMSA